MRRQPRPCRPSEARRNRLLAGLADSDLDALLAASVTAQLQLGSVLHEPGQPVGSVHFPLSGVISLVTDLGGQVVEAATTGNEGMAGVSVFLGAGAPTERAGVQVGGEAIVLDASTLLEVADGIDGPLYAAMRRYTQVPFTLLARNVACNRVHTVQQRGAQVVAGARLISSCVERRLQLLHAGTGPLLVIYVRWRTLFGRVGTGGAGVPRRAGAPHRPPRLCELTWSQP